MMYREIYNIKRMVELTVQIHQLIKEGRDESDEAEKIRHEMHQYDDCAKISKEDSKWLGDLSASLYKLWESK